MIGAGGAALVVVPFLVYGKTFDASDGKQFFNTMVKNFAPEEKWCKPEPVGNSSFKTTCQGEHYKEAASVIFAHTQQGTGGRFCMAKLPNDAPQSQVDTFVQIMNSLNYIGPATTGMTSPAVASPVAGNIMRTGMRQPGMTSQLQPGMNQQMQPGINPIMQQAMMGTPFGGFRPFMDPSEGAFSVDVPIGWNAQGGVSHPIAIDARPWVVTKSPDEMITAFIGDGKIGPYYMPTAVGMRLGNLPGMHYNSGTISPYIPAQKYVVDYATKHLKEGGCSEIKVGPVVNHPELSRAMIGNGTQANAASVTLSCINKKGIPCTAYFVCCTKALVASGSGMWWVSLIGGEAGAADRTNLGLYVIKHMLDTYQITQSWEDNAARTAGTVSRIYKAGADAVEKTIVDGYWARQTPVTHQAAQGDPLQGFDDYVRGQQTVQDPDTGIQYKVGYGNHWINGSGTVGQSDTQIAPDWHQLVSVP